MQILGCCGFWWSYGRFGCSLCWFLGRAVVVCLGCLTVETPCGCCSIGLRALWCCIWFGWFR